MCSLHKGPAYTLNIIRSSSSLQQGQPLAVWLGPLTVLLTGMSNQAKGAGSDLVGFVVHMGPQEMAK